jgi:hypothetical protein
LNTWIVYKDKNGLDNYEPVAPIAYSVVRSDSDTVIVWPHC